MAEVAYEEKTAKALMLLFHGASSCYRCPCHQNIKRKVFRKKVVNTFPFLRSLKTAGAHVALSARRNSKVRCRKTSVTAHELDVGSFQAFRETFISGDLRFRRELSEYRDVAAKDPPENLSEKSRKSVKKFAWSPRKLQKYGCSHSCALASIWIDTLFSQALYR